MTKDRSFRLMELDADSDALRAIRRLEEQLSAGSGAEIALVAYAAEEERQPEE